ncbi:MAG: hypothetical protein JO107_01255 [Hyphomicrobiales bacterium]|nr:hypothetical protein [Hyphomicrobiales bacterium]MBV8661705.1 hypothetical protein [Hyphomicrobiales bacterium]
MAAGVNPFYHYITSGAAEARPGSAHEAIRRAIAPHFDREFYLQRNPDIAATSQDALDHYIKAGWREGRWPTPDFDTDYYVRANPDVIAAGMNPFQHYVVAGKREGRRAKAPFSAIRAVVAETHDLQFARLSPSRGNSEPPTLLTSDEFKRVLGLVEGRRAVVSLSHDEYTKNVGGVQIRVSDEQSAINQAGAAYIHFAPARPVLHVRDDKDFDALALALTIDGTSVGAVRAVDVLDELSQIVSDRAPTMTLVVHSLLGHSIPFIQALAERIRPAESIVWLHDFSTLCTNYSLLRNNLAFCGLPPVDSPMCQVCAFGDTRRADVALIEALFEALNPVVMAPSQAAMDFWRRNARYRHRRTVVAPHAAPMLTGTLPPAAAQRALRVAHVGAPAIHKGWLEYQELAADFSGDPRYSFYLLSVAPPAYLKNVQHVPVSVTRGDRGAMIEALKTHEIDVVVHWTLCYETYSFTAWESILAGSFVVAQKQSGNAAVLIRENNAGLLLDDCAELNQLFASDRLVEAVRRHRAAGAPVGHLAPADMADQILGGAAQ